MTRKEERLESLNWSINDYLRQLKDKVAFGYINANQMSKALAIIQKLLQFIALYIRDENDYKTTEDMFVAEQEKLNTLLKGCE